MESPSPRPFGFYQSSDKGRTVSLPLFGNDSFATAVTGALPGEQEETKKFFL